MRRPAAQNPFCWHWRPSVRGTLISHLILRVDSPAPGPDLASEMAWRLPKPWQAGQQAGALGVPVLLQWQLSVCVEWGEHGRARVLAA